MAAKKYKIIYNREGCIGFGGCAAASQFFEMAKDNKADLLKSKINKRNYELEISEKDLAKNKDAAEICPAKVIHIVDLETGEEIV